MLELDVEPKGHVRVEAVVTGPLETNVYFLISNGEAVVIDPAWDGGRLARVFGEQHLGVQVKAIVCTHGHADHVGGVAGMKRALGGDVPFSLAAADAPAIEANIAYQRRMWGIEVEDPGAPDRLLHEGDVIQVGEASLQVIETPGHTPGGIVLFAATEDGDVAFVGDTLFPGSHGRTDLEGGSEGEILASLSKIAGLLPPDTRCYIGHGPSTTIARELATNPFMRR